MSELWLAQKYRFVSLPPTFPIPQLLASRLSSREHFPVVTVHYSLTEEDTLWLWLESNHFSFHLLPPMELRLPCVTTNSIQSDGGLCVSTEQSC